MIDLALIGLTRFLVGGHPVWRGLSQDVRPRLYFANHSSHLDTLLIWAALPDALRGVTHPVAAADYWGRGDLRSLIATRALDAVLIDRSGGKRDETLEPLREKLRAGRSLIIFPEGTRSDGLLPGPFKSGLYQLACDFPDVELAPVYLKNPSRAFPKGALLPVPISCEVHFGAPIARINGEDKAGFLERARSAVAGLS
ncbi:MAG: 1-acyl-sn-glycerol-3-phosphate acyltransferase [Methylocystis sp.]|nr:MAG: 1-acyl-sn-glycerol-3-phosphate acyltransferase [Methylocystis sp.]